MALLLLLLFWLHAAAIGHPPPPGADTNTRIFHTPGSEHGGSPSLAYVPPGARGAHPQNGTLLAFSGVTRLRRSNSFGDTWSNETDPTASLPFSGTWGGAQTVYDPHRQTLFVLFGNTSRVKGGCDNGAVQLNGIKQLQSTDAGASWYSFVDVESQLVREHVPVPAGGPGLGAGTCLGPTDGEGLIMRPVNGKYGGRMVFCAVRNAYQGDVPVWSDDGGTTFNFSRGVYKKGMDECNIAQVANGSLLLIARNCLAGHLDTCQMRRRLADSTSEPAGSHTFAVSMSHDGGESWGPISQQPQLITPVRMSAAYTQSSYAVQYFCNEHNSNTWCYVMGGVQVCQASIISYQGSQDHNGPALYFSHPYSTTSRTNGTILASDGALERVAVAVHTATSCAPSFSLTGFGCAFVCDAWYCGRRQRCHFLALTESRCANRLRVHRTCLWAHWCVEWIGLRSVVQNQECPEIQALCER